MIRFSRHTARLLCWFFAVWVTSACAAPSTSSSTTPNALATIQYTPANCVQAKWTYTVTIPAQWRPVPPAGCEVQFQDTTNTLPSSVTADDRTESEFFVAGIGVRGPIKLTSDDRENDVAWLSMQPNHSSVVDWQLVSTPIGSGRVYTLDRDRVRSTWSQENPTWRGQYAYIPKGDFSYEVWVRVDTKLQGKIAPALTRILDTFEVSHTLPQQ